MSSKDLEVSVKDELLWDPKVDSKEVAISVDEGVVTLRGTVGSPRQKREAQKDAERVWGVKSVKNELQVRILDEFARDDAELRGAVLQALMLDSLVPSTIDAKVVDGWVRLTGTADWQFEREEAEFIASIVRGVVGVEDEIVLMTSAPFASDVKHSIKKALERNARLDADNLSVDSDPNGLVTVSGTVGSWSEHDEAVAAAWAAPGVKRVDDRIFVEY